MLVITVLVFYNIVLTDVLLNETLLLIRPNWKCSDTRALLWKAVLYTMVLDNILSSPHRRSQSQTAFSSLPLKRLHSRGDELGSWLTLVQRHRFLLTALGLLAFLCTIYLYFAVTLGAGDSCSGLTGAAKASCDLQRVKASVAKGKLKVF